MSAGEFSEQDVVTADGTPIAARFFAPRNPPKGMALIVPAMGVAQSYYAPFAAWLASQGFLAATFDYRGIGNSRRGNLRHTDVDIDDWTRLDCVAMVNTVAARAPTLPLYWIGHSLGGQIVPFVRNWKRAAKIITIATGSGYWRETSPPMNRRAWFLWYVLAPLTTALFGYFPGKRLGIVGDIPKAAMQRWRRWCLHPEYAVGAEGEPARALFASVTTPIVSLSFTDDEFMSARNTASMHGFYVNAPRTMTRLAPADIGVTRIGHFGFFRPEFEEALWRAHLLPVLSA